MLVVADTDNTNLATFPGAGPWECLDQLSHSVHHGKETRFTDSPVGMRHLTGVLCLQFGRVKLQVVCNATHQP